MLNPFTYKIQVVLCLLTG